VNHKKIFELFSLACAPADPITAGLIRDAAATFSINTAAAIKALQQPQARSPSGFTLVET
jgi:hypothetical protein